MSPLVGWSIYWECNMETDITMVTLWIRSDFLQFEILHGCVTWLHRKWWLWRKKDIAGVSSRLTEGRGLWKTVYVHILRPGYTYMLASWQSWQKVEGVSPKADIYRDNICPDMHYWCKTIDEDLGQHDTKIMWNSIFCNLHVLCSSNAYCLLPNKHFLYSFAIWNV